MFVENHSYRTVFIARIESLRRLLGKYSAGGILISRCDNFAWLSLGARNYITVNSCVGSASFWVTPNAVFFITNNIEMERLLTEETPHELQTGFIPVTFPWWELEKDYIPGLEADRCLSDSGKYGTKDVSAEISPLRLKLSNIEIDNYRSLGKACDAALSEVALSLTPNLLEIEVQGILYRELMKRNVEPILALVFGEESAQLYRHNLPRSVVLGKKCVLSICARRKGLVISATRSVLFSNDEKFIRQHQKNAYIDAKMMHLSTIGVRLSDLYQPIRALYREIGLEAEMSQHHQGGITGYNARELICTPKNEVVLEEGFAIAWNPTIKGTKSEDTLIIHNGKNELLSFPEESQWPALLFEIGETRIRRPDIRILL